MKTDKREDRASFRRYEIGDPGGSSLKAVDMDSLEFMEYYLNTFLGSKEKSPDMDENARKAWGEIKEHINKLKQKGNTA